ncbi:EpsD family peptidyl-prolyl cis-trans isomerase [Sphingomonas sp. dw_22]|uniref:EpsD family peptidyl-prolyl cis-trans isomerase n=1 Tax=Sphingomonas sp. dw_22 TaxID=2721175 RepID=UPI001BD4CE8A|nr:EpsD family peptidyl-prolyl cis-trans isomerase [Sphingomonas sp. dw_22]
MKRVFLVSVAVAALSLAGCHGGKKDALDKGQVVATVDGDEITIFELNAELQGAPIPAGADRKVFEQAALQRVIERKILAKIARDRGLDKNPAFLLQERRAGELILAGMLRDQLASRVAQPTDNDIQQYIAAHPEFFAQRKTFSVDQVVFPAPASPDKLREFGPLKTLDQIIQKLTADGTKFQRGSGKIDTLAIPPEAAKKIAGLPAGEVFILPAREGVTANVVTQVNVEPLAGDQARAAATNAIRAERFAKAADSQLGEIVKKAKADVKYQPGYGPPKQAPGAPAAPGTPAVPAPAAATPTTGG